MRCAVETMGRRLQEKWRNLTETLGKRNSTWFIKSEDTFKARHENKNPYIKIEEEKKKIHAHTQRLFLLINRGCVDVTTKSHRSITRTSTDPRNWTRIRRDTLTTERSKTTKAKTFSSGNRNRNRGHRTAPAKTITTQPEEHWATMAYWKLWK